MGANLLGFVQMPGGTGALPSLPSPNTVKSAHLDVVDRDGRVIRHDLPAEIYDMLSVLLETCAPGSRIAVIAEDQELSPNEAAEILGLSRPSVVRRMDVGDLPYRMVGSHRRCRLGDVLALQQQLATQRAAQTALADDTEDLIETHGLD